jgi:hypothetical protein
MLLLRKKMSKADFYTWGKKGIDWVGSLYKNGEPWNLPAEVLLQINKTTYEEMLVNFLKVLGPKVSVVNENFQKWPWLWPTSDMTDYVYMFNKKMGKVVLFYEGNAIDPVRIVQGHDMMNSLMPMVPQIKFPDMKKWMIKKGKNRNGSKPPTIV